MSAGRMIAGIADLDRLDFAKGGGLVTVVAQDSASAAVLMVAHADRAALEHTISTGVMHYTSRTRGPWRKGAISGNEQRMVELYADCDGDAVLAIVQPAGPACHTNATTCFGEVQAHELARLDATVLARGRTPREASHTRRLLEDRNLRLKKIGEEAAELVLACADGDRDRVVAECADVVYHTLVAVHACGSTLNDVLLELRRRRLRVAQGS